MKYILLLIPTISFANFVSEGGNTNYWEQETCEKIEQAKCYALPEDAEKKSLQLVEVDDPTKPITVEAPFTVEPVLDEQGEPVIGDDGLPVNRILCVGGDVVDEKCIIVTGYEKKQEKQFVLDPVKEKAVEDKKKAKETVALSCKQFKTLLKDSAINAESKAADVQEVTRRLLGWWKACNL